VTLVCLDKDKGCGVERFFSVVVNRICKKIGMAKGREWLAASESHVARANQRGHGLGGEFSTAATGVGSSRGAIAANFSQVSDSLRHASFNDGCGSGGWSHAEKIGKSRAIQHDLCLSNQ